MRHLQYCLTHHFGISSNVTNATHFNTPPTLAHRPLYRHWGTTPLLQPLFLGLSQHFHRGLENCHRKIKLFREN